MQSNKFPPNFIFLIFSVGAVAAVLKFIFSQVSFIDKLHQNRMIGSMLHEYELHSLSIFLYQPIVFFALIGFFNKIRGVLGGSDFLYAALYLVAAIPLCAFIGKAFSKFETIKKIHR